MEVRLMDEPLRVPSVREVAVSGDTALLRGYSAWFLGRVLEDYPGGLETLLARSGVSQERRRDILQARAALNHVGAQWRIKLGASASGTSEGEGDMAALASEHDPLGSVLSAREAASMLGISDRQVRSLAVSAHLSGRRDRGGRWYFSASDVAAERERRAAVNGAA